MKYLLLILFILLVIFATKALRGKDGASQNKPRSRAPGSKDANGERVMLACSHCGLHLPRTEALPGRGGVFCSEEHRAQFEARDAPGG